MDSSTGSGPRKPQQPETRLVTAGRDAKAQKGFVNPPVVHGSTVLYPSAEDLHTHLDTVDTPLNQLGENVLCPGTSALEKINASLR